MELAPFILLSLLSILCLGPLMKGAFDVPRNALMAFIGPVVFVGWWMNGASISIPYWAFLVTIGMLVWWGVCSMYAVQPRETMPLLSAYVGMVLFAMLGLSDALSLGLKIVMIGVVANCIYCIMQSTFRYEPWKSSINASHFYAIGFIGNSNMMGYFLTVSFFMSLYLVYESYWWLLVSTLIGYTIFITKCRGAYVSAILGAAFLAVYTAGELVGWYLIGGIVVLSLGATVYGRHLLFRKSTGIQRLRYWRIAWTQFKLTPFMGLGFDGLKSKVPYIQRGLDKLTNGKFLDPKEYETPYPRKCHNDYLQMLTDVGFPGLLLWLALVVGALLSPMHITLKAALVSLLVGGLFLHNWHTPPTNVFMWALIFWGLRSYGEGSQLEFPLYAGLGVLVLLVGLLRHIYEYAMTDFYTQRFMNKKDPRHLDKALYYNPSNGHALVHRAAFKQATGQPWLAIGDTMKGIVDFDGTIRLWELWNNAGKSYIMLGGALVGEFCAREALSLNPHEMNCKQLAFDTNNILTNGYKIVRQARLNPNESPVNGSQHQGICPSPVDSGNQTANQCEVQTNFGGGGLGVS